MNQIIRNTQPLLAATWFDLVAQLGTK